MKRLNEAESISRAGDGESSDSDSEDRLEGSSSASKGTLRGENRRLQDRVLEEQATNRRLVNRCRELMQLKKEAEHELSKQTNAATDLEISVSKLQQQLRKIEEEKSTKNKIQQWKEMPTNEMTCGSLMQQDPTF